MSDKDVNDVMRMMDRNRANRIARQNNGGGGFLSAIGCGVVLLLFVGFAGTGLVEIVQHFI
jgi:hypothetical protein